MLDSLHSFYQVVHHNCMDGDQDLCPVCALYVLVELQCGEILSEIHLDDNLTQPNAYLGILDMNEMFFDPVDMSAEDCYLCLKVLQVVWLWQHPVYHLNSHLVVDVWVLLRLPDLLLYAVCNWDLIQELCHFCIIRIFHKMVRFCPSGFSTLPRLSTRCAKFWCILHIQVFNLM